MYTFVYLIITIWLLTDERIFAGCQLENFAGVNNVAENLVNIVKMFFNNLQFKKFQVIKKKFNSSDFSFLKKLTTTYFTG